MLGAIAMHWLYYFYNGISFGLGMMLHFLSFPLLNCGFQFRRGGLGGEVKASIIFLLTLFLYLRLVPVVMALWKITGDEPHYLLAAHSIVIDHDLDLKNNYLNADYSKFYILAYLDTHTKIQPDGKHFLSHDIGLPFLIAPAYWWKEREGVMIFLPSSARRSPRKCFCSLTKSQPNGGRRLWRG